MLILLIRHAYVSGCCALEQGTRPRFIACDPRRQSGSDFSSLSFARTRRVCVWRNAFLVTDDMMGHTHSHSHMCTHRRTYAQAHTCSSIVLWFKSSRRIYPPTFFFFLRCAHTHTHLHTIIQPLKPVLISSWQINSQAFFFFCRMQLLFLFFSPVPFYLRCLWLSLATQVPTKR